MPPNRHVLICLSRSEIRAEIRISNNIMSGADASDPLQSPTVLMSSRETFVLVHALSEASAQEVHDVL